MKAGRKLDAEIAEKVMGGVSVSLCEIEGHEIDMGYCITCGCEDGSGKRGAAYYSTSIEAAWKVVEKITDPTYEDKRNALFVWEYKLAELWAMSAAEAPEAICIAALRAVGEDI